MNYKLKELLDIISKLPKQEHFLEKWSDGNWHSPLEKEYTVTYEYLSKGS